MMKKLLFLCLPAIAVLAFLYSARLPSGADGRTVPLSQADFDGAVSIDVADVEDDRLLALVNKEYPVPDQPDEAFTVSAFHVVPLRAADITLHPAALAAVDALFAAAGEAGFDGLFVSSGYRDADRQRQIYDEAADKAFVMPPGHSEHQTGLAADILAMGVGQDGMATSPEGRWLAQNAWRHGFVLRYPQDKQEITGIAYEPWHFRYVGQPHARYCYENDLCWEEYIQFLKETGGYRIALENVSYAVHYQTPVNGVMQAPADADFTVSGDNTGGVIITELLQSPAD